MQDIKPEGEPGIKKTLQQELESLWNERTVWIVGEELRLWKLPAGMRFVRLDVDGPIALRAIVPGGPTDKDGNPLDVPVGVFRQKQDWVMIGHAEEISERLKNEGARFVEPAWMREKRQNG